MPLMSRSLSRDGKPYWWLPVIAQSSTRPGGEWAARKRRASARSGTRLIEHRSYDRGTEVVQCRGIRLARESGALCCNGSATLEIVHLGEQVVVAERAVPNRQQLVAIVAMDGDLAGFE